MNLHVTSDRYGLYPKEIAKRIKKQGKKDINLMVNLHPEAAISDEIITYISPSQKEIKAFLEKVERLDKAIFHPYNYSCYPFLQLLLKKFPKVKVYWALWSSELYELPHLSINHYQPFSKNYVEKQRTLFQKIKDFPIIGKFVLDLSYLSGIKKNYLKDLFKSYQQIDFFCTFLPSDFKSFQQITLNKTAGYVPFAYLSLEHILPGLNNFNSTGDKIMIGHSSSPAGNHYEIIQLLSNLNKSFSIFLPLAYGDINYGYLIENEARNKFSDLDVQRDKLELSAYYQKLKEVAWAIINVKVQQGLGNIIALIWMGVKVFLDEDSSTYKDFKAWGIIIFTIQHDLTLEQLSNKLTEKEIENNKAIIFKVCNEELVKEYWNEILS
jgi:hypothetical protein